MYPDTNLGMTGCTGSCGGNVPGEPAPERCPDGSGMLPECAPLAVPYVPFQQTGSKRYTQQEALNHGTLFPGLNLPFHLKPEAANVVNGPLAELQALEFVLVELGQYLDTHQSDTEAFELYRQYAAMEKEGRKKYESMYGPLYQCAAAEQESWSKWLGDPWPWNMSEGGKR